MKKLLAILLVSVFVFTGCGKNSAEFSKSTGKDIYQFANLEWGITQQEAKDFLKLEENDIISLPSDIAKEGFSFKTTVLGKAATIDLLFLDEGKNLPKPVGLATMRVELSADDGKAVYDELCKQVGQTDKSNFIVDGSSQKAEFSSDKTLENSATTEQLQAAEELWIENFGNAEFKYVQEPLTKLIFSYNTETKLVRIDIEAIPMAFMHNV